MVPFSIALSVRPHILTLFFTALTALLLARKRYLLLPLLFLVWANLHGGVLIGLVLLAAAGLGTLVSERRVVPRLALASLACLLATCATPLGLSSWQQFATSIDHSRLYGIAEWRPPSILDLELMPFWVLSAALVVLVAVKQPWRRGIGCESNHLGRTGHAPARDRFDPKRPAADAAGGAGGRSSS